MNLLDMFKKSKKMSESGYLGKMWMCAVKCQPWSDPGQRYGVVIKNVNIVEAAARVLSGARVIADEQNPFNKNCSLNIAGPVGQLEYVPSANIWIGFFETEDEAKDGYCKFAAELMAEIKSASPKA